MYRGYLVYAVLVLALFGYAQYRGWSLGGDGAGGGGSRGSSGGWSWGSWGDGSGRGSSWGGGFHK